MALKPENTVVTINGEKVVLAEFQHWLSTNRFKVYSFFYQKFGVGDSENFWRSTYEGYSPIAMLKEIALQEVTRIKLQMILAKEKGILSTIDYDRIMEDRLKVNASRKEKVARNQAIYGPIEYSPKSYFDYLYSNSVIRLKEKLAEQEFYLDNPALKVIYEKTKHIYRNPDEIEFERIYITETQNKDKVRNQLYSIKQQWQATKNIESLITLANQKSQYVIHYEKITADREYLGGSEELELRNYYPELLKLEPGDFSEILEYGNTIYLLKCLERKKGAYLPFKQVKKDIQLHYVDRKYEELVDRLCQEADIVINKSVYDSVFNWDLIKLNI